MAFLQRSFLRSRQTLQTQQRLLVSARAFQPSRSLTSRPEKTFEQKFEKWWTESYLFAEHHGKVYFPHEAMSRVFSQLLQDTEITEPEAARKLPDGWWLEKKHQEQVPDGWHLDPRYWAAREAEIEKRCKEHSLSAEYRQNLLRQLEIFRENTEDFPPPADRWVELKLDEEAKEHIKAIHGYVPTQLLANRFTETFIVKTPQGAEIVYRHENHPETEEEITVMELDGLEVVFPPLHQTLDWALPTPVPLHSFHELPLIKEVPYTTAVEP